MKYILVSGGVISGIGKGVIASSLGTLMKSCGLRVTSIKIDPYLNIDAGTFSPYEHGLYDTTNHIALQHFHLFAVYFYLIVEVSLKFSMPHWKVFLPHMPKN